MRPGGKQFCPSLLLLSAEPRAEGVKKEAISYPGRRSSTSDLVTTVRAPFKLPACARPLDTTALRLNARMEAAALSLGWARSRCSLYSTESIRACQLASITLAETPTVVQRRLPSVDSIRTLTRAPVPAPLSSTLTL